MPQLPLSLRAWLAESFSHALKSEIESLPAGSLPLEQGVSAGGRVDDSRITVTFLRSRDEGETIQADVGIFFDEIVGGCSCGDEPLVLNAYCEISVKIDKATGEAWFDLIPLE